MCYTHFQDLGVKDSFAPGANFSLSNDPLHISKLVQKAYVKADEKGTEAAAVTAAMLQQPISNILPIIRSICDWDYETVRIFNPMHNSIKNLFE